MWKICMRHPQEYYHGIRIRDAALSIGLDFRKNFTTGEGQRANFAIVDYIQRLTLLNNEQNEIKGIQIEWKEVRVADACVGALLRLQTLTNMLQAAEEGKISMGKTQRHSSCPPEGAEVIRDYFGGLKTGRLIINTEVHPCMRRACAALEALHMTRYGEMQAKGAENKAYLAAFERATPEKKLC